MFVCLVIVDACKGTTVVLVEDQTYAELILLDTGRVTETCSVENESIMDAVDVGSLLVRLGDEPKPKGNVKVRPTAIDGSGDAKEVVACTVECTVCSDGDMSFELMFIFESLVGWLILCCENVPIEDAKSDTLEAYDDNSLEVVLAIDSIVIGDGTNMEGVSVVIEPVIDRVLVVSLIDGDTCLDSGMTIKEDNP